MSQRLDYTVLTPETAQALRAFSVAASPTLDRWLRELIDLRVSQINGCASCTDMHSASLLEMGADPRHLFALPGWREAPDFFSTAERAALAWVEAVNAVPHRTPTDKEFQDVRAQFSDAQIAEMTFAVGAIRSWNMLCVSFQRPVPQAPHVAE